MIEVRGVHPIEAEEPVHLVDVAITGDFDSVDWVAITQPDSTCPPEDWQVPYDERELPRLPDGRARGVFFFHYLDLLKPLQIGSTPVALPAPTPLPSDLAGVRYEAP